MVNLRKCQVLKPVFVPKARRETAAERVRLEQEEKDKAQKRNIEKVNFAADVALNDALPINILPCCGLTVRYCFSMYRCHAQDGLVVFCSH